MRYVGQRSGRLALGVICILGFLACVALPEWNAKFKHSEGWKDGDGGYSIALPPVAGEPGGRTLWFFGDTAFWFGPQGPLAQDPDSTAEGRLFVDPHVRLMLGNNIGISTWTDSPSNPSNVEFYLREELDSAGCGEDAMQWETKCPVRNVTRAVDMPDDWGAIERAGGFVPKDFHPPPAQDGEEQEHRFNWLKDAVYVPDTPYPTDYEPPEVFSDRPDSFLAMGFIRSPGDDGYLIITDVEQGGPERWTYRGPVATPKDATGWGLQFGNALLHVPGDDKIRIYGEVRREPFNVYTPKDMVLAVAWPPTDIVASDRWWYYYAAGTGPCPGDACFSQTPPVSGALVTALARVAEDIVGDFSVDYRCYNDPGVDPYEPVNDCALILTHGAYPEIVGGLPPATVPCPLLVPGPNPASVTNGRYFAFRTTKDDTSWPPLTTGSYGSAPAAGERDTRQSTRIVDWSTDANWDQKLLCGEINAGREVRQVRAHDDISEDGGLTFSYFISTDCTWQSLDPNGCTTPTLTPNLWSYELAPEDRTEANREANLRFGKILLNQLRPWCEAHGTCP